MDQPIRVPRHQTALMQHMQRLVVSGHCFWTADRIPIDKLPGFIAKWQPGFHLRADPAARAYRRRTGRASVHLCLDPPAILAGGSSADWWMFSTAGNKGLADSVRQPGKVFDCRTQNGRLRLLDYELLEQPKTFRDRQGKEKTVTSWTWRITPARYREWEALLVERAKLRDSVEIERIFGCLRMMPMFAGIRSQIVRLATATNKVLGKVGGRPHALAPLPVMRMVRLWQEESEF